ncbi:hypothetical protein HYDPIDRAFT_34695 [Hydnomerulius pinastri MD-312]|uniref:Uncharacterized protein n=1 Tax=Hydnomerulius pinastri MD-312 TaxID=994086 RepID=A0A0C9W5K7_9AGAM|nr:hypothetical protein HYDPIDRAFT_34695 [Hydnomerulius pinastri MD-312]
MLDNSSDVNAWDSDNTAATGNIRLQLAPAVCVKVSGAPTASDLYDALKTEYGKPGIAATYAEFKVLLDITIPSNSHPGPAMNKVQAHFACLKDEKFEISGKVQAMILMAKPPPTMEKDSRPCRNAEANKLSAVKYKQPDPKFRNQQQCPQNEGSSQKKEPEGKGKTRRGKHAGKGGHQSQPQQQQHHDHSHFAQRDDFHFSNIIHTSGPVLTVDPRLTARKTASLQLRPPAWPITKQAIDLA